MADVRITSSNGLLVWLKSRPREDAEIIAFRAASRVFPLWQQRRMQLRSRPHKNIALQILRLLVTLVVVNDQTKRKTSSSRALASNAANTSSIARLASEYRDLVRDRSLFGDSPLVAAYFACRTADHFADPAIDSVSAINTATSIVSVLGHGPQIFFRSVKQDCQYLENAGEISDLSLWPNTPPDWFTKADAETRAIWAKDPDTWAFWVRWWDGVIAGKPLPFDLQRDVALIEEGIWQQGPEAVAEAIRAIEEKHASQEQPDYRVSPKTQLNAEVLVRAAIADFTFDEIRHLMRMVPFPEDIDLLTDAVLLEKFLRDAKGVSRSIETMKAAFVAEGRAMQGAGGLATYLDAVLEEFSAARQLGELNVVG